MTHTDQSVMQVYRSLTGDDEAKIRHAFDGANVVKLAKSGEDSTFARVLAFTVFRREGGHDPLRAAMNLTLGELQDGFFAPEPTDGEASADGGGDEPGEAS